MKGNTKWMRLFALAVLVTASAVLWAGERADLPEFTARAAGAADAVESAAMVREGKWLLVYVEPACAACDSLLKRLNGNEKDGPPFAMENVVVLVGEASTKQFDAIRERYRGLTAARWYSTGDAEARKALKLSGMPVAMGMKNNSIEWTLNGNLDDNRVQLSILSSWVE